MMGELRRFSVAKLLLWPCVVATLVVVTLVKGAPILGPDLTNCEPVRVPKVGNMVNCCLVDRPIKDFQFPTHLPMRVRRPIHTIDDESIRQWERGIALMRALPPEDPRSWFQQYKLHCAYTSRVYKQYGEFATNQFISVHFNYLFLPFHRWYMYFQERILATLLGNDSFSVPYWAWDLQLSPSYPINAVPPFFTNESSSFYDPNRSVVHAPPNRVDLLIQGVAHNLDVSRLVNSNYYQMWRVMKGESATPEVFYGNKLGLGDENTMAGGPFEMGPHTAVHTWVGDERCPASEDMAQPYVSARDPLFGAHHSQVDRLWRMWKALGGRDLDDPDWLGSEFVLYNENGDRVRVNVSASLDLEKLRISYEEVEVDWAERKHPPVNSIRARGDSKYAPVSLWEKTWNNVADTVRFSRFGTLFWGTARTTVSPSGRGVLAAKVRRPSSSSRRSLLRRVDEVLVMSGIVTKPVHVRAVYNIFVELPEADSSTPLDCLESMGQLYFEPGRTVGDDLTVARKFLYKTGMSKKLESLGISHQLSLTVSLVPAWDWQYDVEISVEFTELRMELHVVN